MNQNYNDLPNETNDKFENIVEIPQAIPCAPPLEDDWTLLNQDELMFIKTDESESIFIKTRQYTKIRSMYVPVKNIVDKGYKIIKKNPELGIIAIGLGTGITCIAAKTLLKGGLMYCCMAPNITFNIGNKEK